MTNSGREQQPLLFLADDDITMRIMLEESARQAGFDVVVFENGADLVSTASSRLPDCVLLDVSMPVMDGFDACRHLRGLRKAELLPIVLVTGETDTDSVNRAYDAGATDFIAKPINWSLFGYRLRYVMRNARNSIELREREQRIHRMAYYDSLTGLANRERVRELANAMLPFRSPDADSTALLYLDLDGFKRINDAFGHSFGDRLLVAVADRLAAVMANFDVRLKDSVLARVGGDEFVAMIEADSARDTGISLAEAWIASFNAPVLVERTELYVTPSIGISLVDAEANDFESLLMHADTAMYAAKASSIAHYALFSDAMRQNVSERIELENRLRQALRGNRLTLNYQAKVDAKTGAVVGAEALSRWTDPELGVVPPDRFVAIAEDSGLIKELDQWVIAEVCRQQKIWRDSGLYLPISLNLSASFFARSDVVAVVANACSEAGIEPDAIELEITESTLMHDSNAVEHVVQQLKRAGFKMAIDDFGTGYSSLAYLRRFALDHLKIDRSFVADIANDSEAAAICEGIIGLARSIHLAVIAEGVETDAQREWLVRHGCDIIQGYLVSKPVPALTFYDYVCGTNGAAAGRVAG